MAKNRAFHYCPKDPGTLTFWGKKVFLKSSDPPPSPSKPAQTWWQNLWASNRHEVVLLLQDWNYKMQLKLCHVFVRDIPKTTKTDIYDETVTHVVLIHGSAEDCQLRKIYKAPFLIPVTCHQVHSRQWLKIRKTVMTARLPTFPSAPSFHPIIAYSSTPVCTHRHRVHWLHLHSVP